MTRLSALALGILLAAPIAVGAARSQATDDREAVRQAMLDYVEGIYNVEPARLERSVHPDMVKRGYYREKAGDTAFKFAPMTREQLMTLAANWNKEKKRPIDKYPKEVVVYEVVDQTASGKVTAMWGIDYMHLAKHDGRWKILNIVWQEPPPKK
ncbi:MAG: nuclear transport factor 2 family protein [Acidobacteriota bacterium]|nr:nuclear transport factor 2 family protein [Acidobacteriota bacterium]